LIRQRAFEHKQSNI